MTYLALDTHAVLTLQQVRRALPHMSIPPDADLTDHGYAPLRPTPAPEALPAHRVEPAPPEQGEDGQWRTAWKQVPLTADELLEIERARVPAQVAMRQARLALLYAGMLDDVQPAIDAIPDPITRRAAQIEWEYSSYVERDRPLVAALAAAVGLTVQQVWDLLKFANTL